MINNSRRDNKINSISENGEWELDRLEVPLKKKIGEGTFGQVYESIWRGTPVAVKTINEGVVPTKDEFFKDFIVLTKLHHPNILQLLGACTVNEPYLIVTELMTENIMNYSIRNTKFQKLVDMSMDIARGLAYLHNRRPNCVIHRDLKPTNLLLTPSGKVKIADFGISCFQHKSTEKYRMTGETGSYRYMAPEVMAYKEYDASVDIYSFGMIMYKLFVGIPFIDKTNPEIISLVKKKERPLIPKINDVTKLIIKCWSHDSSLRPNAYQIINNLHSIKNIMAQHDIIETSKNVLLFCGCFTKENRDIEL